MHPQILAVIIQEGGKLLSEFMRYRPLKKMEIKGQQSITLEKEPELQSDNTSIKQEGPYIEMVPAPQEPSPDVLEETSASSIKTGCVPCAIGHFSTCTGVLNESMRFARDKGLDSNEVIDRVSDCLQELNSLERKDLTPEKIVNLPPWQKELAVEALNASRQTRHLLEGVTSVDELEKAVASTQTTNKRITRRWFKGRYQRIQSMSKEEKAKLVEGAIATMEKRLEENG